MDFVVVIAMMLIGCAAGYTSMHFVVDNVAFKIPYAWKLNGQNSLSRDYTIKIVSAYERAAWLWGIGLVVAVVAGIWFTQAYTLFIPVFIGAGYAFAHVVFGSYPSDGDRKAFIREHIAELMKSGWWGSEEQATDELLYNAHVESKLKSGEWTFWWPGRK